MTGTLRKHQNSTPTAVFFHQDTLPGSLCSLTEMGVNRRFLCKMPLINTHRSAFTALPIRQVGVRSSGLSLFALFMSEASVSEVMCRVKYHLYPRLNPYGIKKRLTRVIQPDAAYRTPLVATQASGTYKETRQGARLCHGIACSSRFLTIRLRRTTTIPYPPEKRKSYLTTD